jgi:hypothetical protein
MKVDRVMRSSSITQEPHVLLIDLGLPIRRLEKGKMHGGAARANEMSPSVVKQKAVEC